MFLAGIASNAILSQFQSLFSQNNTQKLQQSFQQLSLDLQSGNLSQAQSDFSSFQQLLPNAAQSSSTNSVSGAQSSNPLATAVSQLAQDLLSSNLTAAQSDLATVQQQGAGQAHHHHHHRHSGSSSQPPIQTTSPRNPYNPTISPPPSKPTPPYNKTCNSLGRALDPHPQPPQPPPT